MGALCRDLVSCLGGSGCLGNIEGMNRNSETCQQVEAHNMGSILIFLIISLAWKKRLLAEVLSKMYLATVNYQNLRRLGQRYVTFLC